MVYCIILPKNKNTQSKILVFDQNNAKCFYINFYNLLLFSSFLLSFGNFVFCFCLHLMHLLLNVYLLIIIKHVYLYLFMRCEYILFLFYLCQYKTFIAIFISCYLFYYYYYFVLLAYIISICVLFLFY